MSLLRELALAASMNAFWLFTTSAATRASAMSASSAPLLISTVISPAPLPS